MISKTQVDWRAIARDYTRADCTIMELCVRHSVSRSSLYRRIKAGVFASRSAHKAASPAARDAHGLLRRLTHALDDKMTKFEQRLQCNELLSSADHEREARTLHSLLRMFERVSELSDAARKAAAAAPAAKGFDADADIFRRQLAARLDKLRGGDGRQ